MESFIERHRKGPQPESGHNVVPGYRRGLDVVGYTGFVPGKYAGNVYARTFSNANHASEKLARKNQPADPDAHNAFVENALRKFEDSAPSNKYGNFHMYGKNRPETESSR